MRFTMAFSRPAAATVLLLLAVAAAAISTATVDAAKRTAGMPMASPSVRGGKSRSLRSSSSAKRAASLPMPSRSVGGTSVGGGKSRSLIRSSSSSTTTQAELVASPPSPSMPYLPPLMAPSLKPSAATQGTPSSPLPFMPPDVASVVPPLMAPLPKPSSPPTPASSTCVGSLLELSPCLAFFKDAGATAAPEGCCAGLRSIVDSQAVCLCHIVNHTLDRAIGVDIPLDRAFILLGDICHLAPPQEVFTTCGNKGAVPPLYSCPAPSA
ncbi:hypothetical protein ACP70R_007496 [Stipagrostis hirtigluma subsp. patula]